MSALLITGLMAVTQASAQISDNSAVSELSGPPYRFIGIPELKVAQGSPYTVIFDEHFQYGWTGHILADVHNTALLGAAKFKTPALAAGQAVYGLPMGLKGGTSGARLFWCAPVAKGGAKGWWATCVTPGDKVTYTVPHLGLTVQRLDTNTAGGSEAAIIRAEPAMDLPQPLHITHRVGKWHKSYVELTTLVSVDGRPDGDGFYSMIARDADGSARFAIGGGIIRLVERADSGFTASIESPLKADGNAMITFAGGPS